MKLNVNYILESSEVQGPGKRFTIWVQGCSIKCKDCCNRHIWSFEEKKLFEIEDLSQKIINSSSQGLTLTGGEPLDQFSEVLSLSKKIFPFKNIFLCSGYDLPIIQKKFNKILAFVDIICSGPFIFSEKCSGEWKGSSNQRITYLTVRGKSLSTLPIFKKEYRVNKQTGEVLITGFSV